MTDYDNSSLALFNNEYEDLTLAASGAADYTAGTVLAFDATTGNYKQTVSGTAAIANAKAILAHDVSFSEAGTKLIRAVIAGDVDQNLLIWDGTDTPDTIPAGAADSFRLQLRAYGIILKNPLQLTD